MNCKAVQSQISAYLDEELGGREMLAMRAHLSGCPECANELRCIESVKKLLSGTPVPAPSEGFEDRLVAGVLVKATPAPARRVSFLALAGIAAATMLATFGLLNMIRRDPTPVSQNDNVPYEIVQRDRAYSASTEPLLGSPVMMPMGGQR